MDLETDDIFVLMDLDNYEDMLDVMQRRGLGFLGPSSRRYASPAQLLAAGLMKLPG